MRLSDRAEDTVHTPVNEPASYMVVTALEPAVRSRAAL